MKNALVVPAVAIMLGASGVVAGAADLPYDGEGHLMLDPAELEWSEVSSMAAPAQISVIEGELANEEPFTFRLKLPAGYQIDPHTHPAYERVTVISGTLHFAHGESFDRDKTIAVPQGGVAIMPPGAPMYGYTEEDTVIQVHGVGPWGIEYINPEDDPRG
jgi:quercetin dioxygenase-like cupin family protein